MFIRPEKICQKYLVKRILLCFEKWHCLSDSEIGRLADNRRMQRVANAAVLQVHIRDKPTVTPHHIHSYNAYLRPFFSCFRIPPGGLFSPSILLK